MPLPPIDFRSTDICDIELIRPLWIELNRHHHANAGTFRTHYERMTFDERRAYFGKVAAYGSLRLDLACDPAVDRVIGYCVSSLSKERMGEIESIFVEKAYRSRGIGSALVSRAFAWLDAGGSLRNRVSVAEGNEQSIVFYRKFGFCPRMTVLEQVKDPPVQ